MKRKLKELMSRLFTVPAAPRCAGAGKQCRGLTHATTRGRVGYGIVLAPCAVGLAATAENASYYDPISGTTKTRTDAAVVTVDTATFEDGKWYVVTGNVTRAVITPLPNGRVSVMPNAVRPGVAYKVIASETPDLHAEERPIGVIDDPSLKFFKIKGGQK